MAGELVTGPGLIQYGNLLLGRSGATATRYRWRSISGWEDTPGLDSGTVLRSGAHGAYPGRLLAQTRVITLEEVMVHTTREVIGAAVRDLAAATPIDAETEQDLVVQLDERGPLLCRARVLRRQLPVTGSWRLGYVGGGAIQWEASDPRRYELVEQVVSTGLPQPEVGLSWPLAFPLNWGTGGSTGNITATNSGDASAHPTIEFRGPVTTPSLTNLTTGDVLEYNITLAATDVLTVDTWAGTVVLNGSAGRLYTATTRSVPEGSFTLPPGSTTLAYRDAAGPNDPAASCTIRFRSAYW